MPSGRRLFTRRNRHSKRKNFSLYAKVEEKSSTDNWTFRPTGLREFNNPNHSGNVFHLRIIVIVDLFLTPPRSWFRISRELFHPITLFCPSRCSIGKKLVECFKWTLGVRTDAKQQIQGREGIKRLWGFQGCDSRTKEKKKADPIRFHSSASFFAVCSSTLGWYLYWTPSGEGTKKENSEELSQRLLSDKLQIAMTLLHQLNFHKKNSKTIKPRNIERCKWLSQ